MRKYASKWEEQYASRLETLKRAGEIRDFKFEPMRILLANKTTYLPDFLVVSNSGYLEFHEVKGFIREDALVKFKIAAEMLPMFDFLMITKHNSSWETIREYRAGECIKSVNVKINKSKKPKQKPGNQFANFPDVTEWNPTEFYTVRTALDMSIFQIAPLAGVSCAQWEHWESGKTTIYSNRHITAMRDFMKKVKELDLCQ